MSPRPNHGTSRSRRRSRRQEERTLVAGATGSTSLPLSNQDDAWDAGAAAKGLTDAQLPEAFFWVDAEGDKDAKASYKLGFAENRGGTLTAVWRGVTAAAGAVQGARGGVDIPDADVAGVKSKIGAYYEKAAKQYDDDNIKPPWAAAEGQSAAFLLAYAEIAVMELAEGEVLDRFYADDDQQVLCGLGGSGPVIDEFLSRVAYWEGALAAEEETLELAADLSPERATLESVREALGGDPSKGTDADKRLKKNRLTAAADGPCAECEHTFDMHEGDGGACSMDGCSCDGFVAAAAASDEDVAVFELPFAEAHLTYGESRTTDTGVVVPLALRLEPLPGAPEGMTAEQAFEQLRVHLENFELAADGILPEPRELIPPPSGPQAVVAPPPDGGIPGELRWVANMVPEGTLTDDGRAMAPGAISWRELPLTLMAMVETTEGGHVGAEVAGRIDDIHRDGHMIKGSGVFAPTEYGSLIASLAAGEPVDPELLARVQAVMVVDEAGALVASLVADQTLRGISVDLAIHQYEVGPKSDYFDADGNWLTERPERPAEEEEPSLLDLLYGEEDDAIFVVTEAVIGAVTVCPFQAFADATIALAASLVAGANPALWTVTQQSGLVATRHARVADDAPETALEVIAEPEGEVLTASAAGLAPEAPPSEWFNDPELTELTPLTVDEDGRIFGHAAPWDTCHIGIPGVCTTAPQTETNYAYFLLKEVLCDDGELVPVGTITLGTGHANKALGRADATEHYDNTGLAAADVNVGEDEFGIWVAGALRPDIEEGKARVLRGAVLSGDWRNVNGNLELVALLAVNVPGFPVPRARALVAAAEDGFTETLALTAAGITIGRVGELDADGDHAKVLSPLQLQKIQALGHVASGRYAGLVNRSAIRAAAGFES